MAAYSNPHLASAIIWWLNYISAVGREYIIAESTLKIPATEYLERFYRDYIELEYNHPNLSQKRFDLYFNDLNNMNETAFEFKFVREDSTRALVERKRIFYDLMRLYLFKALNKKGYFLICGNQLHFKSSFQNLNLKPKLPLPSSKSITSGIVKSGFFGEWFSFDISKPDRIINLNSTDREYKKIYKAFIKEYSKPYKDATKNILVKPNTISTKLIFISEGLVASNIPQTFSIGIWEVNN